MSEYVDLLQKVIEREKAELPKGCDTWGIKSTRADLKTKHGFQWPPKGWVEESSDIDIESKSSCPSWSGDGICVARNWAGMASGGFPARTLLLVAFSSSDVLADSYYWKSEGKTRVSRAKVLTIVDGERLVREVGRGADLRSANLTGFSLSYSRFDGANLDNAFLERAGLYGAKFNGAKLCDVVLNDADVRSADFTGSTLRASSINPDLVRVSEGTRMPDGRSYGTYKRAQEEASIHAMREYQERFYTPKLSSWI